MRFFLLSIFLFLIASSFGQKFYPAINSGKMTFEFTGYPDGKKRVGKFVVDSFEISSQVTLGEYKIFLDAVKKDSGQAKYVSMLPDSSIMNMSDYETYIHSQKYDNDPVVGVSWRCAMAYCKWKTIKNNTDSINFIYRLPTLHEWRYAKQEFFRKKNPDFEKKLFADWMMESQDESFYNFTKDTVYFPYVYLEDKKDPNVLKRKRFVGSNWFYQDKEEYNGPALYGYSDSGYKFISVRIVKVPLKKVKAQKQEEKLERSPSSRLPHRRGMNLEERILIWWGVKF